MNELAVKVSQQAGVIVFNFDELKENLETMMAAYEGATFSEDTVKEARGELATLRKIDKALSDRRIEIKKEFMKPYDDFESRVKELNGLIQGPIALIDKQVKVFEAKQKEEKKAKIAELYEDVIGGMGEYLPLEKIYNAKWENATTKLPAIKEEIEAAVASVLQSVDTISNMNSESVPKALELFKADLSLANAIAYVNNYENQKQAIIEREKARMAEEEERKRLAEIERIRQEERNKIAEEERIKAEERRKIQEEQDRIQQEKQAELLKAMEEQERILQEKQELVDQAFNVQEADHDEAPFDVMEMPFSTSGDMRTTFTVIGTAVEIGNIEMYMDSIGVAFERRDI